MRLKPSLLKGLAATGIAAFCAAALSSCAPVGGREWGACTAVGAGLGAGAGAAAGLVIYDNSHN
jgi:hypothetical protein